MIRRILINLIAYYQALLSPDHSLRGKHLFPHGYCRYYPSCSEYTKQAISTNGMIYGTIQGIWRILRCNPFSKGGLDPVLKSKKFSC